MDVIDDLPAARGLDLQRYLAGLRRARARRVNDADVSDFYFVPLEAVRATNPFSLSHHHCRRHHYNCSAVESSEKT